MQLAMSKMSKKNHQLHKSTNNCTFLYECKKNDTVLANTIEGVDLFINICINYQINKYGKSQVSKTSGRRMGLKEICKKCCVQGRSVKIFLFKNDMVT